MAGFGLGDCIDPCFCGPARTDARYIRVLRISGGVRIVLAQSVLVAHHRGRIRIYLHRTGGHDPGTRSHLGFGFLPPWRPGGDLQCHPTGASVMRRVARGPLIRDSSSVARISLGTDAY